MDSMGSNQDILNGLGFDFEETYSHVAMAKFIQLLLVIAAWYDYEIWHMDVKMAVLNGFIEEDIYMDQPEGFTSVGNEKKVCCLQRSIYGLKYASRSWNMCFDEVVRGYDFTKHEFDPYTYKKINGSSVAYLVLYVNDILLFGNDVKMLGVINAWLSTQFFMKDMGCIYHTFPSPSRRSPVDTVVPKTTRPWKPHTLPNVQHTLTRIAAKCKLLLGVVTMVCPRVDSFPKIASHNTKQFLGILNGPKGTEDQLTLGLGGTK
ncbi:Retrovirus-related Pol polyprotein from transposon RE1 [Sesamum angolense]|uniref:Retrovirus-related Pol polyprotein from transposon RE1 n=1 Tax=Sesamum angolense TaxID=2727404 RepID=A0AAE2BZ71_9LAMI|nr:Retrovirus-related Pol polyprotein from transposon RE1 [Sesamum angolense]